MDKATKTKIILFASLGIFVLVVLAVTLALTGKGDNREEDGSVNTSLRAQQQSDFTLDDMMNTDGRPGAGLLRPERTEILAPGDRSRDDRLPESQGEKRSCVPGEKQGFRVWVRGRDKAGNVAKPESGSFCRIQV